MMRKKHIKSGILVIWCGGMFLILCIAFSRSCRRQTLENRREDQVRDMVEQIELGGGVTFVVDVDALPVAGEEEEWPDADPYTTSRLAPEEISEDPSENPSEDPSEDPANGSASDPLSSAEGTEFLEKYLKILACLEDVSDADYLPDDVRKNWEYLPYAARKFAVNVVWEDENEIVISCYRRSGKAVDDGLRYDLMVFRNNGGGWYVNRSIHSESFMMEDVSDQVQGVIVTVFNKARTQRPLTDEDIEAVKQAVLDKVMELNTAGLSADELAKFKDEQTVLYKADWEKKNLPKVLSWTFDYRKPVALVYEYYYLSGWRTDLYLYVYLENGQWTANLAGSRYILNPPVSLPNTLEN